MTYHAGGELAALVRPDRVHKRLYTDPAIFELELERIFGRTWIYVGHESQAKQPGDWFTARMGREPIIVTRDQDGKLHALVNRCPHRGAKVCQGERGHDRNFSCPYHAWTFRMDGSLESVPRPQGYKPEFLKQPETQMARAARVASYRGFIFASFAADGPGLDEHLGPLKEALDNMVDRSPTGELQAEGGVFKQEFTGNWKMHMENAVDLIHPGVVHESSVVAARQHVQHAGDAPLGQPIQMFKSNGLTIAEWDKVRLFGAPQGHVYMGAFYRDGDIAPERQDPVFQSYRAMLVARHGEEKTRAVLARQTFNNLIWPNLSVNPLFLTLRFIHPVAVDRTVVYSSCFRLVGAPEEFFRQTITFLSTANSPSSLISTDDLETFERCQAGLVSDRSEWINLERHFGRDDEGADGSLQGPGTSELPMRAQMRAWLRHMAGEPA